MRRSGRGGSRIRTGREVSGLCRGAGVDGERSAFGGVHAGGLSGAPAVNDIAMLLDAYERELERQKLADLAASARGGDR